MAIVSAINDALSDLGSVTEVSDMSSGDDAAATYRVTTDDAEHVVTVNTWERGGIGGYGVGGYGVGGYGE